MKVPHLCLSPLLVFIDARPLVKDEERQPHQGTILTKHLDSVRVVKNDIVRQERIVVMTYLTKIDHFSQEKALTGE